MGSSFTYGKKLLLFSCIFVVLLAIFLYIFSGVFEKRAQEGVWDENFGSHFKVQINDKIYEDVDIEKISFPHTMKGDELNLSTILPDKLVAPSILIFRTGFRHLHL